MFADPTQEEGYVSMLEALDPEVRAKIKAAQKQLVERADRAGKRAKLEPDGAGFAKQVEQLQQAALHLGKVVASAGGGTWSASPTLGEPEPGRKRGAALQAQRGRGAQALLCQHHGVVW